MGPPLIVVALAALLVIPILVIGVLYVLVPIFKGIGWVIRQAFRFIVGEVGDGMRIVGAAITQVVLFPLIIINVLIGRWSASAHFGRAFHSEIKTVLACLYRMVIGHPARLLCLTALTDGLEKRLPEVMAAAPTADTPNRKTVGLFDGYRIVGSLPGGGSGGKLYVAEPDAMKLAIFARNGRPDVKQVVIKTFSLKDGSSLPQIVRESRALEAAKRLGLVLEHELSNDRFYYVTEFVPGESLALVTQRLHAMSDKSRGDGLDEAHLRQALGYSADLLRTLNQYHQGGLWHKDVKPDNIIVGGNAAHLVDFGLVTPLRSGMTLTTHGTEYFRDPELVRLALKGVKVHQVDGAKFDVYAAGAVLFSMIENSFPAHGGLSQITKRCPEALRWIVRRSMADYDKRYPSASAMLADLDVVRRAADPFALRPIDLPSMRGAEMPAAVEEEAPIRPAVAPAPVGAGSDTPGAAADRGPFVAEIGVGRRGPDPVGGPWFAGIRIGRSVGAGSPTPPVGGGRFRPNIRVNRWWTGGYVVDGRDPTAPTGPAVGAGIGGMGAAPRVERAAWAPPGVRRSAKEQLQSARARAKEARARVQTRMAERRRGRSDFRVMNAGVVTALFLFFCVMGGLVLVAWGLRARPGDLHMSMNYGDDQTPASGFATLDLPDGDGSATVPTVQRSNDTFANDAVTHMARKLNELKSRHPRLPLPHVVINKKPVAQDEGAAFEMPASIKGEKVLVISDVVPYPPAVSRAIQRLTDAGFTVLGNYPENKAEEVDLQQQLDLEAAAKQLRALSPLDADDTQRSLGEWTESEGLGLLVWFNKPDPAKAGVQAHVFSPQTAPGADAKTWDAGTAALRVGVRVLRGS